MKRYKICGIIGASTSNPIGRLPCKMIVDPNGEWVKYEDVIESEDQAFLAGQIGWLRTPHDSQELKAAVCNCEAKSQTRNVAWPSHFIECWICPAHGYKQR